MGTTATVIRLLDKNNALLERISNQLEVMANALQKKKEEEKVKKCYVCGSSVAGGAGTHYAGRLVHKNCLNMAKILKYKLMRKTA